MKKPGRHFEAFKEWVGNGLLIGYGGFFTWVFYQVHTVGEVMIYEPNLYIRLLELIGAPLIAVLGIERLVMDIRKTLRNHKKGEHHG